MSLHVGLSGAEPAPQAVGEAIGTALRGAKRPAFALVFCTDRYAVESFAGAVSRELGTIPWAGCCAPGVFAGQELLEQGVVVGVFSTDDTYFGVGIGGPLSVDARAAGRAAGAQAVAALGPMAALGPNPGRADRTFIVLPDAFAGNASDVVRGAAQAVGAGAVWAGGGAGDNMRFAHNAQFAFGTSWRDRVVVIAIDSPYRIAVGIRHGWHPYGPAVTVTRSTGVTANELDYDSAFAMYQRTAARRGEEVDERSFAPFAMSHPLGIPQTDGEFVIRDPLSVEADGSLRCTAEVPDGSIVRVMEGDRAALIAAARTAAVEARCGLDRAAGGAIVFDCVSRRVLMGRAVHDELAALQEGIGRGVPLMGCLTLGEVGAFGLSAPQFHNKTAVVLALPGERSLARAPDARCVEKAGHARPPEHAHHRDALALASALQELTVSALELFDPQRTPHAFLDRLVERLGCYAALLFETDENGAPFLAGANGLATASSAVRIGRGVSVLGSGPFPIGDAYPELVRRPLVSWHFPMGPGGSLAQLQLFFPVGQGLSPHHAGMVERLTRILGSVIVHRRLFARTFESERHLATERAAVTAARAVAERANASKDELLAVISHEIRNRLNPVLQWTRLLRSRELAPERVPHALEVIERNAMMQRRMVEDLLDLGRASSGTFRLTTQAFDLGGLLVEEAESVAAQASQKGIEIHLSADGPAIVCADVDRIRQVLANLLENAVKFTPNGGRIDAGTTHESSIVRFRVHDTGRGIPDSLLPHVFDLFQQGNAAADPTSGSRGSGLGIGLALAQRIVKTHGGTIVAESAGVDQGTTFTVELPAAA